MISKNVLAIDIGVSKTKLIIGKYNNKVIKVVKHYIIDTPTNCYQNGTILNKKVLAMSVLDAIKDYKKKLRGVIFSISSMEVITRDITLPKIKSKDMESMIRLEIQQYLPISLEDYVMQFKVLEEKKIDNINKYRIKVAVLPVEIAKGFYELAGEIGLKPIALDLHENAVSKLLCTNVLINKEDDIKDKTVAVIDLGNTYINVCILDKGIDSFNRIIPKGSQELSLRLARSCDIFDDQLSEEDVWGEVASSGMAREVLDDTTSRWAEEISRLFRYYTSRSDVDKIQEVYVYGGIGDMGSIRESLSGHLNIPVNDVNSLSNVQSEEKIIYKDFLNVLGAVIRK